MKPGNNCFINTSKNNFYLISKFDYMSANILNFNVIDRFMSKLLKSDKNLGGVK